MRKPVAALIDTAVHLHADIKTNFMLCPANTGYASTALLEATNAMERALDALRLARMELDMAEQKARRSA